MRMRTTSNCISYIGTDSNGCMRFVSSGWIVNGPGSAPTALVAQAGMSILKQNANSDWPLN